MRPLLLLFIAMPILEMWLLITVGSHIGALPTIGLVLLTAVVGLALLRRQGLSTLMRAQQKMQTGEVPAREMAEGIFLAVGGVLLLTPGFITDALGFACLTPGLRQRLLGFVLRRMQFTQGPLGGQGNRAPQDREHNVIEGDYSREESRGEPREESNENDRRAQQKREDDRGA
jgi:UPF0716 protein FxsA